MSLVKKAVKGAVGATAVFGGVSYLVFNEVINRDAKIFGIVGNKVSSKKKEDVPKTPGEGREWIKDKKFEEFTMVNDRGMELHGYLLPADKPSNVYAFCSHGYRSSGKGEYAAISRYYHEKGFNVFLVDHQSAGQSEGKYIGFGYYEYRDCIKWLNFMRDKFGEDIEIILHGISMGSATVMLMTGSDDLPDNVKFTVADCGYTSAWNQFEYNLKSAKVPVFPLLNGANFWSKIVAGYDFKDTDTVAAVKRAKIPMLFVHGTKDDFVPTYMGRELYEACGAPYKELLLIEGAWHARSFDVNPEAYEAKLDEYVEKFI